MASIPTSAPGPTPAVEPAAPATGELRVVVVPWADVAVDGAAVGQAPPARAVSLTPGTHTVRLTHTDYKPLIKKVEIRSGQTTRLNVNMKDEAFPLSGR
jgi:hypothetical protein